MRLYHIIVQSHIERTPDLRATASKSGTRCSINHAACHAPHSALINDTFLPFLWCMGLPGSFLDWACAAALRASRTFSVRF